MKRAFEIGERSHRVEVERLGEGRYRLVLDGRTLEFAARRLGEGRLQVTLDGESLELTLTRGQREVFVSTPARDARIEIASGRRGRAGHDLHASGEISLPMPGKVVKVFVAEGDAVVKGQPLLVVEAMKMEHSLKAPRDGIVGALSAREGAMVVAGEILLQLEGTKVVEGGGRA